MIKYKKIQFIYDCITIQKELLKNGYEVTLSDIDELYSIFSEETYCAGWYGLDNNSLKAFIEWFEENYASI